MRFPGLSGIQRIRFANAIRSRALEEPIVDAVGRHFSVPPEAVTVLGVEYRTVPGNDDSADPGGRALTESTDVVMSLELRESTEMVNVTAARASVPLDMQNLWRLRADLLGHQSGTYDGREGGWMLVLGERRRYQPKKCFFSPKMSIWVS